MKAGAKTSEFWLTVGAILIPGLIALGVIPTELGSELRQQWAEMVPAVAAAIISVYTVARTIAKIFDAKFK